MAEPPVIPTTAFEEGRRRARGSRADEVLHTEALPEPAEPSALAPAREGAGLPVAELARAFQSNAEALRTLGSMHADLLQAVQRNDRSEMMLASTQALNDTFRQLAHIQREILGRLEENTARASRGGRLVPLLLLGVVGVVVLATWVLVDMGQRFIDTQPDAAALTAQAARLLQEGREEAAASSQAEAARIKALLEESEERLRGSQSRLDQEREERAQAQRELGTKEAELDALRRQAGVAQTEALKMVSLEAEVRDLTAKVTVSEPRLKALSEELDEVRRENARLRRKLAGAAYGLPDEDPALTPESLRPPPGTPGAPPSARPTNLLGSPPSAPAPAASPPAPAVRPEPESARDPRLLGQVRTTLNSLFEAARTGRTDYWQVMRVDGVTQDRLRGVIANRYDAEGRLLETVEAQEAFVWVERDRRRVLFEVREGQRIAGGQRSSLPEGKLTSVVAEGEAMVSVFSQAGLRMVRTR